MPNASKLSDGGWRCKTRNTEKSRSPASVRWSALLGGAGVARKPCERAIGSQCRSSKSLIVKRWPVRLLEKLGEEVCAIAGQLDSSGVMLGVDETCRAVATDAGGETGSYENVRYRLKLAAIKIG